MWKVKGSEYSAFGKYINYNLLQYNIPTPAPELALCGDEEAVGGTGPRHHTADLHVIQAAVTVRTPQVLA
jgi:hypothetical protein